MLTHSKSKSKSKKSTPSAGGGGGRFVSATGRDLGKSDKRAICKGLSAAEEFQTKIASVDADEFLSLWYRYGWGLARVEKHTGVLHITDQDGERCTARIAGNQKLGGKIATKAHLPTAIAPGDLIIVRGGQAVGKLQPFEIASVARIYAGFGFRSPRGFFGEVDAAEEEEGGFAFDRSEEAATAKAEKAEFTGAIARARALRCGGAAASSESDDDSESEVDFDDI